MDGTESTVKDTNKQQLLRTFKSLDEIAQLTPNDFAFVKRTSGEWQLAVVVEVSKTHVYKDKYIKFLFDMHGHVKTIPAHQWTKFIRLVRFPSNPVVPIDPEGIVAARQTSSDVGDTSALKPDLCSEQDKGRNQIQRCASNDIHQRAFMSALSSIDHSPRSARARIA